MTDDLSNQLRSLNTFEWMARPATTKQICFDAADNIEKLVEALADIIWNCPHRGPDDWCGNDYCPCQIAFKGLEGKND